MLTLDQYYTKKCQLQKYIKNKTKFEYQKNKKQEIPLVKI